jgi:hypothetical protein
VATKKSSYPSPVYRTVMKVENKRTLLCAWLMRAIQPPQRKKLSRASVRGHELNLFIFEQDFFPICFGACCLVSALSSSATAMLPTRLEALKPTALSSSRVDELASQPLMIKL